MVPKGIYLTDPDLAAHYLEQIKGKGTRPEDYVIRSIMLNLSGYEEGGWVSHKEAQQDAWGQLEEGHITKALLDRSRRSMYNTYGLVLTDKIRTSFVLQLTPPGIEFLTWLLSDPEGIRWGNKASQDRHRLERTAAKNTGEPGFAEKLQKAKAKEKESVNVELFKKSSATTQVTQEDYDQLKKDLNFPEVPEWGMIMDEPIPWPIYRHLDEVYVKSKGMHLAIVPGDRAVVVVEELDEPNEKGKTKVAHHLEKWTDVKVDRFMLLDEVERLTRENEELRSKLEDGI